MAKKEAKDEALPKIGRGIQRNGITRPSVGTTTAKIWEIADAISEKDGEPADRKAVLDQAKEAGINNATAATQYGKWRKFHGLSYPRKVVEKVEGTSEAVDEDVTVEDEVA